MSNLSPALWQVKWQILKEAEKVMRKLIYKMCRESESEDQSKLTQGMSDLHSIQDNNWLEAGRLVYLR